MAGLYGRGAAKVQETPASSRWGQAPRYRHLPALIGFFLPTEDVEAEGFAQAVLVDVRNGYTYGMATAVSEDPTRRLSTSGNSAKVQADARAAAQARAVEKLATEVETMVRDLRLALAEQREAESHGPKETQ